MASINQQLPASPASSTSSASTIQLKGEELEDCPKKEEFSKRIEKLIRGQKKATEKFLPTQAELDRILAKIEEIEGQNGNNKSKMTATVKDGNELSKNEKLKLANFTYYCKNNVAKDQPHPNPYSARLWKTGSEIPMLPVEMAYKVIARAHTGKSLMKGNGKHRGVNATYATVQKLTTTFPRGLVTEFIDICPGCQSDRKSCKDAYKKRKPDAPKNGGAQSIQRKQDNKMTKTQQAGAANASSAAMIPAVAPRASSATMYDSSPNHGTGYEMEAWKIPAVHPYYIADMAAPLSPPQQQQTDDGPPQRPLAAHELHLNYGHPPQYPPRPAHQQHNFGQPMSCGQAMEAQPQNTYAMPEQLYPLYQQPLPAHYQQQTPAFTQEFTPSTSTDSSRPTSRDSMLADVFMGASGDSDEMDWE